MRALAALAALTAMTVMPLLVLDASAAVSVPDDHRPTDSSVPGPADGFVSGPEIVADRTTVSPGGRVTLSVDGFESRAATIMTCGNEARRGSSDCNMAGAFSNEFDPDGSPMALSFVVQAPPVDCPCVLRAVGRDNREVALTPIVVAGHPVGPLVDPETVGDLVEVSIDARPRAAGVMDAFRSSLGGPASYQVTVIVRNVSTSVLRDVDVSGTIGRGENGLESLVLDEPGTLAVGQSWRQTVDAVVPAPSFGEITWRVVASGAGPSVEASSSTNHRPWLLIVFVLVLVSNVGVLSMRWRVRRRAEDAELVSSDLSPSGGRAADELVGV